MALTLRQIVCELERRQLADDKRALGNRPFPAQQAFIEDTSRFIDAQCSRRAGKTNGLAERYRRTMQKYPKSTSVYLSLTRDSAKEIMWPVLEELKDKHSLPWRMIESKLLVVDEANGSRLRLWGADQKNFIKKLKGKKHPGIGVDESQDFGSHLESLIDDVLTPCMIDYEDGWLALTGTPGPIPAGYWFEVTKNRKYGFSHHEWTLLDNPYLPNPEKFIEDLIKKKEWRPDHPTLLREWRNQWVLDLEALWIRYRKDKCDFLELPRANWVYILGVDLGHDDADALAVLAYREGSPDTYLVDELVMPKQGITELVGQIEKMRRTYPFSKMVCDEGALGKKIAEEIRRRHHIPLHPADKARKQETVAFLNDAMRCGRFKARSNSRFVLDSYNIQIDRMKTTERRIILKGPHSDIIDAVIYAFKESPAYAFEVPKDEPKPGTPAWGKKQEEDMFEQARERALAQKRESGDPFGGEGGDWG